MFLSPFQGDNLTPIPFALLWEILGLVCLFWGVLLFCLGGFLLVVVGFVFMPLMRICSY